MGGEESVRALRLPWHRGLDLPKHRGEAGRRSTQGWARVQGLIRRGRERDLQRAERSRSHSSEGLSRTVILGHASAASSSSSSGDIMAGANQSKWIATCPKARSVATIAGVDP